MALMPRTVSLAVFRVHIENGLSVAAGIGLIGLLVGWAGGFDAAIAAAIGALAVSISDQPDPLHHKPWVLGLALALTFLFTALASFGQFHPLGFIAATAFTGLFAGLLSAYGRRALSLSMTAALAFVFAMGQHFPGPAEAVMHLSFTLIGASLYAAFAGFYAWALDDRLRRLLLAEAMRAFAQYLRAKAALYNPDAVGPGPFRAVIDAYAALADRLQAARDTLFSRRSKPLQLKRIDALIALLDTFETVMASDADFVLLRRSQRRDLKWRLDGLVLAMADRVEDLALTLRARRAHVAAHAPDARWQVLAEAIAQSNARASEGEATDHAFAVSCSKLALADGYIGALAAALDAETPPTRLASELNLPLFLQRGDYGIGVLLRQFDLKAPAMRYAIRLALAMTAGLALTLLIPHFAHANWVLLTIALIMRANYSVTSRRRWDRVTGTLIGCAAAVALIDLFPAPVQLAAIVLAVGVSHAYATMLYRVTAIGASISSLLLLHFSAPLLHPQFFERIVDTLIGAALSWAFSFLLPSWERNDLPRVMDGLLAADTAFADAAMRLHPERQAYRLARKKTTDAVAQLAGAIRRVADEPHASRRVLAALNELLGAHYLLAADLASMPVLMRLRGAALEPAAAAWIDTARARVLALLKRDADAAAPPLTRAVTGCNIAMTNLARRLAHIEESARRVVRLGSRPVLMAGD